MNEPSDEANLRTSQSLAWIESYEPRILPQREFRKAVINVPKVAEAISLSEETIEAVLHNKVRQPKGDIFNIPVDISKITTDEDALNLVSYIRKFMGTRGIEIEAHMSENFAIHKSLSKDGYICFRQMNDIGNDHKKITPNDFRDALLELVQEVKDYVRTDSNSPAGSQIR